MSDFQIRLRNKFLSEAKSLLAEAEVPFTRLDRMSKGLEKPEPELIHEVFRFAHNFKGTAAAAEFEALSHFVHKVESLILKIKKGSGIPDPKSSAALLQAKDSISSMIEGLTKDFNFECKDDATEMLLAEVISQEGSAAVAREPEHVADNGAPTVGVLSAQAISGSAKIESSAPVVQAIETLKVPVDRLDQIVNLAGELMVAQLRLAESADAIESYVIQDSARAIKRLARELHDQSLYLRLSTLKPVFLMMNQVVRETARGLKKEVEFQMFGENTEIDKTVLEHLADPLLHLMRNAVDHGLEMPDQREILGKPRAGKIRLVARREGSGVLIEVSDDGQGLDAQAIKQKAIETGLLNEAQANAMSEDKIHELIFAPGFSTKQEVSNVSGRGIGMDVVQANIQKIQGSIEIETATGIGTCFKLRLPLSLATVDGIVVKIQNERYVIPESHLLESSKEAKSEYTHRLDQLLSRPLSNRPVEDGVWLSLKGSRGEIYQVWVDDITESSSLVLKKLDPEVSDCPWILGGAILGDGLPALILNIPQIVEAFR